ncbi:single-stranded DNA-binding protein [Isoptericola croceus]|uniref:single-stranded DNA-binding protein n=1 Tax=Isoptericola croceus TaxID=3031406 RepID=UPI0023F9FA76|nr:single-stranded DNA-binding protein [Isoptericola croceus]
MNAITFVGNLTRDPEVVHSESGMARARISIALDLPPARDGQNERDPEFRNITVFGKQAENVGESLSKGDRIVVVGRSETYQRDVEIDGEDKKVTITSYVAQHIGPELRFATASPTRNPKGDDQSAAKPAAKTASKPKAKAAAAPADEDDDF